MRLDELRLGQRFRLPYCGKTGTLLGHGVMGARVSYAGSAKDVAFEVRDADEVVGEVAFTRPGRVEIISNGTEVELA